MLADLHVLTSFAVTVSVQDQTATLYLRGDLDACSAAVLAEYVAGVLAERPSELVLDLAGLSFTDCAGARALARAGQARAGGPQPVMRSVSPAVRRVLELTGLSRHLTIDG